MAHPDDGSRRNFPLSALFVLVAACAVVTSLITPVVRSVSDGSVGLSETLGASAGGTAVIMVLGGLIGLYHYNRMRGFLWGALTGAVIGLVVGPIVLAPARAFPSLMSISAFGAVVLVLIGTTFRLMHR